VEPHSGRSRAGSCGELLNRPDAEPRRWGHAARRLVQRSISCPRARPWCPAVCGCRRGRHALGCWSAKLPLKHCGGAAGSIVGRSVCQECRHNGRAGHWQHPAAGFRRGMGQHRWASLGCFYCTDGGIGQFPFAPSGCGECSLKLARDDTRRTRRSLINKLRVCGTEQNRSVHIRKPPQIPLKPPNAARSLGEQQAGRLKMLAPRWNDPDRSSRCRCAADPAMTIEQGRLWPIHGVRPDAEAIARAAR